MLRLVLLGFITVAAASAQPFGVGAKIGRPLSDAFDSISGSNTQEGYESETASYVVGPFVELRLPFRFAVEVDALYRSLEFGRVAPSSGGGLILRPTEADSWEFPFLLKKRMSGGLVQPFVAGGFSYNRLADVRQSVECLRQDCGGITPFDTPPELQNKSRFGFVAAAGVDFRALFLRIAPEVRFTRWTQTSFADPIGDLLDSNDNQFDFLVGISF